LLAADSTNGPNAGICVGSIKTFSKSVANTMVAAGYAEYVVG
jgi:hypothetical protein